MIASMPPPRLSLTLRAAPPKTGVPSSAIAGEHQLSLRLFLFMITSFYAGISDYQEGSLLILNHYILNIF
jgi:hypothetical protein